MLEEWRDVKGYEGIYQVSNKGEIRSLDRVVKYKNYESHIKGKMLKLNYDANGYCRVRLYRDGVGVTRKVHRLVAEAFLPNTDDKPQVDHINTIKDDNRVENLRWATAQENSNNELTLKHAMDSMIKGKDHHSSKGIICNGVLFSCIQECSDFYGIRRETMARWLNKTRRMPDRFKVIGLRYEGEELYDFDESTSEEVRKNIRIEKIANSKRGQKAHNAKCVICDSKSFESIKACAEFYGVNNTTMQYWLNGRNGMPNNFRELGLRYKD